MSEISTVGRLLKETQATDDYQQALWELQTKWHLPTFADEVLHIVFEHKRNAKGKYDNRKCRIPLGAKRMFYSTVKMFKLNADLSPKYPHQFQDDGLRVTSCKEIERAAREGAAYITKGTRAWAWKWFKKAGLFDKWVPFDPIKKMAKILLKFHPRKLIELLEQAAANLEHWGQKKGPRKVKTTGESVSRCESTMNLRDEYLGSEVETTPVVEALSRTIHCPVLQEGVHQNGEQISDAIISDSDSGRIVSGVLEEEKGFSETSSREKLSIFPEGEEIRSVLWEMIPGIDQLDKKQLNAFKSRVWNKLPGNRLTLEDAQLYVAFQSSPDNSSHWCYTMDFDKFLQCWTKVKEVIYGWKYAERISKAEDFFESDYRHHIQVSLDEHLQKFNFATRGFNHVGTWPVLVEIAGGIAENPVDVLMDSERAGFNMAWVIPACQEAFREWSRKHPVGFLRLAEFTDAKRWAWFDDKELAQIEQDARKRLQRLRNDRKLGEIYVCPAS